MVGGSWQNQDGMFLQYGVQKAIPEQGGDYLSYGQTRILEVVIPDMTALTTSPLVQSFTSFFPEVNGTQYVMVESVEQYTDIAVTGTSAVLDVGLGYIAAAPTYSTVTQTINGTSYTSSVPSVTSISDTAFINAMPTTVMTTLGSVNVLNVTASSLSTYGGGYIGNAITVPASTHKAFVTAKYATAAFTAGAIRVRIRYRCYNAISQ